MEKETMAVFRERRSVRRFRSEQVDEETLRAVVEAGQYAPTAMGTQGIQIVVVQDPADRAEVDALNARAWGRPDAHPYYGAPTIVLIFATDQSTSPELDGAAACTAMLYAAHAAGLGSCWINRPKQVFETEEGKTLLRKWGLPETLQGVASIALGYADGPAPTAKPRREGSVTRV